MTSPCDKDQCGKTGGYVTDSRETGAMNGTIRRRRECQHCGHRWTTFELPADRIEHFRDIEARMVKINDAIATIAVLSEPAETSL